MRVGFKKFKSRKSKSGADDLGAGLELGLELGGEKVGGFLKEIQMDDGGRGEVGFENVLVENVASAREAE